MSTFYKKHLVTSEFYNLNNATTLDEYHFTLIFTPHTSETSTQRRTYYACDKLDLQAIYRLSGSGNFHLFKRLIEVTYYEFSHMTTHQLTKLISRSGKWRIQSQHKGKNNQYKNNSLGVYRAIFNSKGLSLMLLSIASGNENNITQPHPTWQNPIRSINIFHPALRTTMLLKKEC
jgi:hypothetical protein